MNNRRSHTSNWFRPRRQIPAIQLLHPFGTLDDAEFLEATQRGRQPRLTRRSRHIVARRYVEEEEIDEVVGIRSRYNHAISFRLRRNNYDLRANLQMIFDQMTLHVQQHPQRDYRIRFAINGGREYFVVSSDFTRRNRRVFTAQQWIMDQTFEDFYNSYMNFLQSNEEADLSEVEFILDSRLGLVAGCANVIPKAVLGLFFADAGENMCGYAALAAYLMNRRLHQCLLPDPVLDLVNNSDQSAGTDIMGFYAFKLQAYLGGEVPMKMSDSLQVLVDKIPSLRVVVYGADKKRVASYVGLQYKIQSLRADPLTIWLLYHDSHLVYIRSPTHFFLTDGGRHKTICHGCFTVYRHDSDRLYGKSFGNHQCVVADFCRQCKVVFYSPADKQRHEEMAGKCDGCDKLKCTRHVCVYKCINCGKPAKKISAGKFAQRCDDCVCCKVCHSVYSARDKKKHSCYMRKSCGRQLKKQKLDSGNFYVFDFESMFRDGTVLIRQGQEVKPVRHEVNYVVYRPVGGNVDFTANDLTGFIESLVDGGIVNTVNEVYFIAHNLKGYDGRLLFDHLVSTGDIPYNVMWRGSKILSMSVVLCRQDITYKPIIFRDSVCHLAFPLSMLPDIFGLDKSQYKKGFFPYKFNRPENQNYIGPIPARQYFEPDFMPPAKRKEFLQWYAEQEGKTYHFRDELIAYCRDDVKVLSEALKVYAEEGQLNNGINPLSSVTIAQYAMTVYKNKYLPATENESPIAFLTPYAQKFARDALFGGRTDVRQMMRFWTDDDVAAGYYGVYQDVQSLYPTVQFYDPLPVGIPNMVKYSPKNQPTTETLKTFFGFIKCDLTPITYMHHPVLVERKDGKLMADLLPKKNVSNLYLVS